jgi:hypothetical protein
MEFATFCSNLGIHHRRVTPYWPAANSEVERFFRTIEKAIRTAQSEGKIGRQQLSIFLLNYRTTPHTSTGASPAHILMHRNIRTKLPCLPVNRPTSDIRRAMDRDKLAKQKMKAYADKHYHTKPSPIKVGDMVLVRQTPQNKLSSTYDPHPYKVIHRKGSAVTLQRGEKVNMRNVALLKRVTPQEHMEPPVIVEGTVGEDDLLERCFDQVTSSHDNEGEITPPNTQVEVTRSKSTDQVEYSRPQRSLKRPGYLKDYV